MKKKMLAFLAVALSFWAQHENGAFAQTYKLVAIQPYKLDHPDISWSVDTQKDSARRTLRYRKGTNDVVLTLDHAVWNPRSKRVEIQLSIGPVQDGQVRFDLDG